MAEAGDYKWEDGSPGVRYPRERVAPVTHAHTSPHPHHHTNTHTGRITPRIDAQHTMRQHHH